jgi:Membrane iron-sulfur containing protein FtrD-like
MSDGRRRARSCPACGAQVSGGRFCADCGADLNATPQGQPASGRQTGKPAAAGAVKTTGGRKSARVGASQPPAGEPGVAHGRAAASPAGRQEKRDQFLGRRKSRRRPIMFATAGVVIVAALAAVIVVVMTGRSGATTVQASAPSASSPTAAAVSIPLAKVAQKASFYAIDSGGTQVKFFVMKASDGKIRNAFDACQVCFSQKKGYHQEGDQIVCNNCGRRFDSALIGIERGGCNPVPFETTTSSGNLVIAATALQTGVTLFQ